MANPRKFSEKIALHNQKQAEETAAFEAIIKEVTSATRGPGPSYPKQHLPITPNLGVYRGGSLPNVNQIGGSPGIDLQTALQHLDDIRHGKPNLVDRIHRVRPTGPHRRFPVDKRADCSPYGSTYLSPPPDTSWRRMYRYLNGVSLSRTNSDSALHTSAMAPIDSIHPNTPPTHRRIAEVAGQNMGDGGYWDPKKLAQSRPKSCEVPNINIYPSQEQDSGAPHIPISNNTGSLPDLTVLNFPSPMATPLDVEPQDYQQQGSPVNLSPTSLNHMTMSPQQQHVTSQQSPGQRRRHAQGVPSPLVLSNTNQMRIPLSPPVGNMDPSKLSVDPRIRQQYLLYMHQQQQQRHRAPNSSSAQAAAPHPVYNNHHPHPHQQQSQTSPQQQQPYSPHHRVPQVHITSCEHEQQSQPSMTQYRNNVSETGCQSPTSPLSQPSYSPAQSPGLPPTSTINSSPFAEAYYLQQQQQTNALQQQFEQFHMERSRLQESTNHDGDLGIIPFSSSDYKAILDQLPDNTPISTMESAMSASSSVASYSSAIFSQSGMDSQDFQQQQQQQIFRTLEMGLQQQQMLGQTGVVGNGGVTSPQPNTPQHLSPSANNKIPDIVLTGADDTLGRPTPDFAKDLGNAITGMSDSFDTDFFSTDEAFKAGLDPLDLDGLQMLTDPNMVTDPATEDTFKLDRL
ncbi:CREB-regulated transcription coactivator 1-like isoform X1 [Haliotis rubra]|uniref:CREB-regulated transcription coactivator 1-like isoform X1 n=1 Tax=Haliotis rubra TaxID=36100 RepID=UPI001EE54DC2|nr:CREB-regulated transcription coactivator 1-like isoform X1 [Haliotis rubra]